MNLQLLVLLTFAFTLQGLVEESSGQAVYEIAKGTKGVQGIKFPFRCNCVNRTCECCGDLFVPIIRFNEEVCNAITYNGERAEFGFVITINGQTLFNQSISAHHPDPICVGYPPTNILADICFDFYDIQILLTKFRVCLALKPRLVQQVLFTLKIGCFQVDREPLIGEN